MPNVQYEVDQTEIEQELMSRQYMIHGQRPHGIQLTVADPTKPRFKFNGAHQRKFLAPVSKEVYRAIRRMSSSVKDAADRIEAVSHGQEIDISGGTAVPAAPPIDAATIERIVGNRVDTVIAQRTAEIDRREQALADREAKLAELPPAPVNKGKGAGKPRTPAQIAHARKLADMNKRRAEEAHAREMNEPVLTPEQQELAKKAGVPLV